mgnify:CR=1 FL=1
MVSWVSPPSQHIFSIVWEKWSVKKKMRGECMVCVKCKNEEKLKQFLRNLLENRGCMRKKRML